MAKTPDEIVAEIDRKQNEEDLDLPRRAAKAALNLVKPKATKPDTGETTNPMGDKYKKGGKVKKMADGGMADEDIADKLGRLGLKAGTADYALGQKQLRSGRTAQELDDLLPSREKIGSALRSKLDPEIVMDAISPTAGIARRVAKGAEGAKAPRSYAEESGMKKGGKVSSASKRADGCCIRGKTRA